MARFHLSASTLRRFAGRLTMVLFVALVACLAGAGCRDRYTVRHAASPNPLKAVRTFALEPLRFSETARVEGKSEVDWLAKQPDETRLRWPSSKTGMVAAFQHGLASAAGDAHLAVVAAPGAPGTHVVRATVRHIEPGFFSGPTSSDTMVEIDVEIVSPEGIVLDALTSRASVSATALNLELGDRLRDAAKDVGTNVAGYLRERTGA